MHVVRVLLVLNAAETSFFFTDDQYCRRPPPSLIYGPPCFTHTAFLDHHHHTRDAEDLHLVKLPVFSLLCELVCFFKIHCKESSSSILEGFLVFFFFFCFCFVFTITFFVCLLCCCILSISLFFCCLRLSYLSEPSAIRCGSSWLGYLILCYFSASFHF